MSVGEGKLYSDLEDLDQSALLGAILQTSEVFGMAAHSHGHETEVHERFHGI